MVVALRLQCGYSCDMAYKLPPIQDIASQLNGMTARQVQLLALLSGVPEHTLLKVRSGQTPNPRYCTVRAILPLMGKAAREAKERAKAAA